MTTQRTHEYLAYGGGGNSSPWVGVLAGVVTVIVIVVIVIRVRKGK
jgi:hypothetical protein